MNRLFAADFLSEGQTFHAARSVFQGPRMSSIHDHDFFEVWWIDSGHAVVAGAGGEERRDRGALAFVLPEDAHGFRPAAGAPFRLSNLAFAAGTSTAFRALHPEFFSGPPRLRSFELEPAALARVDAAFELLVRGRRERLDLERFLLALMIEARDSRRASPPARALPEWLEESLRRLLGEAEPVRGIVSRLAGISGRSREHVSRVISEATGMTAVAFLRSLLVEEAAIRLALGDESIAQIALGCGFENLGHFYEMFKRLRGVTPAEHRARARGIVGRGARLS